MKNFELFVDAVVDRLRQVNQDTPEEITSCRSGEDFELCVYNAARYIVQTNNENATVQYTKGSHAFPDIVIEYDDGDKYGIEVKCSTTDTSDSWKINGNSVLGSTKKDVIDTFLIFGKTKKGHVDFKCKRYEEAISNVVVTHSPRYKIDLDVTDENNFFKRSGLTYKQVCESDDPIGLITKYFKSQGQHAWWLSESAPAAIRMFCDLSKTEQAEIIGYCFAHFPEIFSNDKNKFTRCAVWMVADRSVISSSLRDCFTAGGKVNIATESTTYTQLPRIFLNLQKYRKEIIKEIEKAKSENLYEDWYQHTDHTSSTIPPLESIDERIDIWAERVSEYYSIQDDKEATRIMIKNILLNI